MAKVKGRSYQEYYISKEEVPEDLGGNTAIIYEQPTRILTYENMNPMGTFNFKGINYQNTTKEVLTNNLVFMMKQMENLRREFASEKIKNEILTKRLAQHNINTTLTPREIEEYEVYLTDVLSKEIKMLSESETMPLKEEIIARIRAEISKAELELNNNYKYNIVRINNALKYNDMLLDALMTGKNKDMSMKDKTKAILDIQKANRDNIEKLKDIYRELGINVREKENSVEEVQDVSNTNDTKKEDFSPKGFDLSSFMNKE